MKKTLPTLALLFIAISAFAQIDMQNGLEAHYVFAGDATDQSSNHYDGTLHGFAHVNSERLVTGDNIHDFLELPPAIMDGLTDFTITFKVAFESFHVSGDDPKNQVISGYGPDVDAIGIDYNRSIQSWEFTVNGETKTYPDANLDLQSKTCIFLTRKGDSLSLYVDAMVVDAWSINTTPVSINNLVVGQHATCSFGCYKQKQCMNGHMEGLAFWNRALDADEIDLGCKPPHAVFSYANVNCTDGIVDFVNESEHSDFFSWSFGDGGSSTDMNPEHGFAGGAGTYNVTLVSTNQWSNLHDTLTKEIVATNTTVDAGVSADGSTSICDGSSVVLNASPADASSYQWSRNGDAISGATDASYTATEGGDYSVSVVNATGCSGLSGVLSVSISASPTASITPSEPVAVCQGNGQLYSANTGNDLSYQWMHNGSPITGATNDTYMATSAGEYSVIVTNSNNCTAASNTSLLEVNENPTATITPTGEISACAGSGLSFSANTGIGITYQWMLDGSAISGATDDTYSTNVSGNYSVVETNSSGCSGTSESTSLTINPNPDITVTPDGSTTFCEGGSVLLTTSGSGDLTYAWKKDGSLINGATDDTYVASNSGSYTVKVTDPNGCKNSSTSVEVTVNENPSASISPSENITFCEGASQTYTANAGGGLSYQWMMDGSAISGATNQSYSTSVSGTYSVVVTNGSECSATSSSSTLTVNANPAATITPDGNTVFCDGGSVMLNGNEGNGYNYQWQNNGDDINGATDMSYTATTDGNYTVKITDANGCKGTSEAVSVTVNANPEAIIDPSGDISFCDGGSQMYSANEGDFIYQWTWNGDAIEGETNSTYTATTSGSYAVIVWNANGCSATSSTSNIDVMSNPEAIIDPSGDVSFCDGGSQMYSANEGDFTYQWTLNGEAIEGETNSTYTATTSGSYAVIVWNGNGCSSTSASSTVEVHSNPEATIDPSGEVSFCEGASQTYTASGGGSYQWLLDGNVIEGATNSTYAATSGGNYSVIVTSDFGCSTTSSSSQVTVNANPEAIITANGDLTLCQGKNVELSANSGDNLTYQWQQDGGDINGATDQNYLADESSTYTVVVTNTSGCTAISEGAVVIVNPLPEISLGDDITVCDTSNYHVDAGAGYASYLWNDNSTNQTIAVTGTGYYSVIITDANGCSAGDSVFVTVDTCVTGINEVLFEGAINIYPNPTFGVFVVEINVPATPNAKIDLVNTLGQYVKSIYEGALSGRMTLPVDGNTLSKGVYFVKMYIGDLVVTKKIVIAD